MYFLTVTQIQAAQTSQQQLQQRRGELNQQQIQLQAQAQHRAQLQLELGRLEGDQARLEAQRCAAQGQIASLSVAAQAAGQVVQVLGPKGLRAHLLQQALGALESLTNAHLATLWPGVAIALPPPGEGKDTVELVEGRGLISHRGRWCLVGFARDANAIRYFYLDRIVSVNVTKTQFRADPKFNIKEHTLHPLTLSIHEAAVIDLLLHEEGKEAMVDFLSGIPDNRVKFGNEKNAARIQLRIKTTNKEALFSFMFRNPGVVVQIGPEDIRKDYLNYIARIRSQYGANP
jgi:predicted DNA-binding transcriptional regulator YafY